MKDHLLKYVRFNLWANKRVNEFLKTLNEEQINKEIISSFPSVRKTLCHVWGAQDIWLKRLHGNSPSTSPIWDFKGSFEEATTGLLNTSEELIGFIEKANEELLESILHYKTMDGTEYNNKIGDIIQHVVNHSTFHRGQIITMFRQLGYTKLFSTDYISFCRE